MAKNRNYSDELVAANKMIRETFKARGDSSEAEQSWSDACRRFHSLFCQAHLDRNFYPDEEEVKSSDPKSLECAIGYLFSDPIYYRSGYNKQRLIRALKKASLTEADRKKLVHVMLKIVDSFDRREFRDYCRLAKLLKSDLLIGELKKRFSSTDEGIRRRAKWMVEYCEKTDPGT